MKRAELRRWVSDELGTRQLIWFGTRGEDIESIADLPQLHRAFSLVAAYQGRSNVSSLALEDLSGIRMDLDTYELDDHPRDPAVEHLRHALLRALSRSSAVVTYRPSRFLSAVAFARQDRCRYLGMFKDHQFAFEHKPWVESAVAELGIPGIRWAYVADDDQIDTLPLFDHGSVMLRRSRTTGGVGLTRVNDPAELQALWPEEDEAFVSVAPFLEGGIPVNVGAVAWHDGVTVHPASIQLIGQPELTNRPFGFCGNDFGSVGILGGDVIDQIEGSVVRIGDWMRRLGFLGAFGVDFLVVDGTPLFTEVNPRLQGSTHLSCRLSVEADEGGLLLEHLAALLGHGATGHRPLSRQARDHDQGGHVVAHWLGDEPAHLDLRELADQALAHSSVRHVDVVTRPDLMTEPGAAVVRITTDDALTSTGFDLVAPWVADLLGRARAVPAVMAPGTHQVGG